MIDASTKTARTIAVGAVLVAAGVHSCMNAAFGWTLGSHTFEKYLFASFGVATDVCKVFALAFAANAFERGRWVKAVCCLLVWVTTVAYSGAAALGFAALARDTVVASRAADVDDYASNTAEKRRLLADMEAARTNPMFSESYGCTQDLVAKDVGKNHAAKAKQFCHMYWASSAKYDAVRPIVRNATLTQADPQTAIMASMLSLPREKVALGLAVFLAVVAEIVSSLGTWTFSRSIRKPDRTQQGERRSVRRPPQLVVNNA